MRFFTNGNRLYLIVSMVLLFVIACEQVDQELEVSDDNGNLEKLIKRETHIFLKDNLDAGVDSSVFRDIHYHYDDQNRLLKVEKLDPETSYEEFEDYEYNEKGQLAKKILTVIGWESQEAGVTERKFVTEYTYQDDLLYTKKGYHGSIEGYTLHTHFYSEKLLDSIVVISDPENKATDHTVYFKYADGRLIEKGVDKNDERGLNTKYIYEGDLLVKEYDKNWITEYEYDEGRLVLSTVYFSDENPYLVTRYVYHDNILHHKIEEHYSAYCLNYPEDYCNLVQVTYEYK